MALDLSDRLRKAGCEVSGDGDFVVKLGSDWAGNEYFCYETEDEADAALIRLTKSARDEYKKDGMDREVSSVSGWPTDLDYIDDEDEEDED